MRPMRSARNTVRHTVRHVVLTIASLCGIAPSMRAQSIRVAPTPSLRLGANEADAMFDAIAGSTRLADGRIVVGNRGEHALFVFSPEGTLERKLGRKGAGPGEVEYLLWLHRCGNALFTGDMGERVQEFGVDLGYRRRFRFKSPSYRIACNARQQFVHMGWDDNRTMRAGVHRSNVRYWLTGADSASGVTLGMHPGSERYAMVYNGKPQGTGPRALGREPSVAMGAEAAYIATADSLTILVHATSGAARAPIVLRDLLVPSTPADVDALIEQQVGELGEKMRDVVTRTTREMPRPKYLPAVRALIVDETDLLWVQRYPRAGQRTVEWIVMRPNGTIVSRVQLPASLVVDEIGRDYLLGHLVSEDGEPEVRLYAVTR